jgi:hypothetical protein
MWIMSTRGFISIVKHNKLPGVFQVRARVRADLEALCPGYEVQEKPGSDYLYRADVPAVELVQLMADEVAAIDYTSHVKDVAIKRSAPAEHGTRSAALYATWNAFANLQKLAPYQTKPRPPYKAWTPNPAWKGSSAALPPGTGTGVKSKTRSGHYNWDNHPQSTTFRGGEEYDPFTLPSRDDSYTTGTYAPDLIDGEDDFSDIPDSAFQMTDEEWEAYLADRELKRIADAALATDKPSVAKGVGNGSRAARRRSRKARAQDKRKR